VKPRCVIIIIKYVHFNIHI